MHPQALLTTLAKHTIAYTLNWYRKNAAGSLRDPQLIKQNVEFTMILEVKASGLHDMNAKMNTTCDRPAPVLEQMGVIQIDTAQSEDEVQMSYSWDAMSGSCIKRILVQSGKIAVQLLH